MAKYLNHYGFLKILVHCQVSSTLSFYKIELFFFKHERMDFHSRDPASSMYLVPLLKMRVRYEKKEQACFGFT